MNFKFENTVIPMEALAQAQISIIIVLENDIKLALLAWVVQSLRKDMRKIFEKCLLENNKLEGTQNRKTI